MQRNLQQQLDGFARRSPGYGSRYYIGNGRFMRLSAADVAGPGSYDTAERPRADKGRGYRWIKLNKKAAGFTRVILH